MSDLHVEKQVSELSTIDSHNVVTIELTPTELTVDTEKRRPQPTNRPNPTNGLIDFRNLPTLP